MILSNDKFYIVQEPGAEVKTSQDATGSSATMTTITTPRRSVKKYVIIGVTCFVIVALLVTGALVAVKLITDTQKDIYKYDNSRKVNNASIEDTVSKQSDDESMRLIYHFKNGSVESWGITDYYKRTVVIKFDAGSGDFVCFVDLNVDLPATSGNSNQGNKNNAENTASVRQVRFRVLEGPLNSVFSLLEPAEQNLCSNAQVYLVDQVSDSTSVATTTTPAAVSRSKRYFSCSISLSNCQTISFGSYVYFGCPRICITVNA